MLLRLDETVLAWRYIEGDVVVVDLRNSEYFSLSTSAQHLWPRLAAGTTPEELAAALVEEYAIPLDRARRDVEQLCSDLDQRGVLVYDAPASDTASR